MAKIKNVLRNIVDNVNWNAFPSHRDGIAMLNPKLAQRKGYKPAHTRKEYRMAGLINDFHPVSNYKNLRASQKIGVVSGLSGIGASAGTLAALSYYGKKKKEQEDAKLKRQMQEMDNSYAQSSMERDFTQYDLPVPPSGGAAYASAWQDLQQKKKNKMHPDKYKAFSDNNGAVNVGISAKNQKPDYLNENYFHRKVHFAPKNDESTYEIVENSGYGYPVMRTTSNRVAPKIEFITPKDIQSVAKLQQIIDEQDASKAITDPVEIDNMMKSLAKITNMLSKFKGGPRYQHTTIHAPINIQSPNKGSSTLKRMNSIDKNVKKSLSKKIKNKYF
jgi:hypothetical protein